MSNYPKDLLTERLAAVNRVLHAALDGVSEGVLVMEPGPCFGSGPRIVYANQALSNLVGCQRDVLIGQNLSTIFPLDYLAAFLPLLHSETKDGEWRMQGVLQLADNGLRAIELRASASRDQVGSPLNFTLMISAAKRDLAEAEDVVATLPNPKKYQADVVANLKETSRRVVHEFNNALTSVMMALGAARMTCSDVDLTEKIDIGVIGAQKAAALARDFLDTFRPRSPSRSAFEATDISDLVSRSLRLAMAGAPDVRWEMQPSPQPLWSMVDPEQIDRVIFNLVKNACEAMEMRGRLVVRVEEKSLLVGSGQLPPGDYVVITVRDYGPGIPEEHLRCIFNEIFTTKPNGNGCGLPICLQIVKNHGGDIEVSSKINVGTAFGVVLPKCAPPTTPSGRLKLEEALPPPQPMLGSAKLCIVDDDDLIRITTLQIAQKLGWSAEAFANSDAALAYLLSLRRQNLPTPPILLDINLGGSRNGFETLEEIQRLDPDAKVIATSGDHGDPEEYRRVGFATFLPKPYNATKLDQTLREVLSA